jgi:hypothetical protein
MPRHAAGAARRGILNLAVCFFIDKPAAKFYKNNLLHRQKIPAPWGCGVRVLKYGNINDIG